MKNNSWSIDRIERVARHCILWIEDAAKRVAGNIALRIFVWRHERMLSKAYKMRERQITEAYKLVVSKRSGFSAEKRARIVYHYENMLRRQGKTVPPRENIS